MTQKTRKQQSNTVSAKQKAVRGSFTNIEPPKHMALSKDYLVFFDNVIAEFAKSEWTQHQLEIACLLARAIGDANKEQLALQKEGYIVTRQNGTTVENPRNRVVKSITGDILALRRSLALHARARTGDNRIAAKQKKGAKSHETDLEDDLIARPMH